jgi:hypothetical protein
MLKLFNRNKVHRCNPPEPLWYMSNRDWKCYKCKAYWYKKYDAAGGYFVKRR